MSTGQSVPPLDTSRGKGFGRLRICRDDRYASWTRLRAGEHQPEGAGGAHGQPEGAGVALPVRGAPSVDCPALGIPHQQSETGVRQGRTKRPGAPWHC